MTQFFLERKVFTYFFTVLLVVGGVLSFFSLGQLEDPIFTVKKALIITEYPGADPQEVELEVTDVLEKALREITELDDTYSWSRAGRSIIKVEIKQQFWSDVLPQKWDLVRKKIKDNASKLPPGTSVPDIIDDFNFVYGFVLAITGDGFSYKQLEDYADDIKKELEVVTGVARVDLWGVQPRVIYLDVEETQLAELGVSDENIRDTLQIQNKVVNAGWVDVVDRRLRFAPTGEFYDPQEIGDLAINPRTPELVLAPGRAGSFSAAQAPVLGDQYRGGVGGTYAPAKASQEATQIIRIRDLASVREGYLEPPPEIMRFNGKPALAIKIAGLDEFNIVDTGKALEARVQELVVDLPVGIELHKVAWQSRLVSEAVNGFMISLIEAVLIVLVVLALGSGVRMGLIIGSMLIFIILGTFVGMAITATPLQRMSLGALIIAMGMMVDNSCFVADDIGVRLGRGEDRMKAAIAAGNLRAWPLLGATIIATMAFFPIFASDVDAGEYCRTLFTVVGIALVFSWFISMTLTPAMCVDLLPEPKPGEDAADPYDTAFFRGLRRAIEACIRKRWLTLGVFGALLLSALFNYPNVRQMFFPFATRDQIKVDVWGPEGGRIQDVAAIARPIEEKLLADERVVSVASFIGNGPPRYYLPEDPENPNPTYAEIVANTRSYEDVNPLAVDIEPWLAENVPVLTRVRLYDVGPADTWKFEARLSGPAQADLEELRGVGNQIMEILRRSPLAREVRSEMRNQVQKMVPVYSQERGRWASITREDVADATLRSYDGIQVGLYREEDDIIPIVLRNVEMERAKVAGGGLVTLQVPSRFGTQTVPIGQVTDDVHTEWEDPIIHRWQRRRAMTVQASPKYGETFPSLYADVIDEIEAIDFPPGYEIFWDGEWDSSADAQGSLLIGVPVTFVLMLLIIMLLYNSVRVLACVLLMIPFASIGVIYGLWALDSPMGFVAILGILSLTGMMIKNMIVLTDAIKDSQEAGLHPFDACVQGAVSQARPIALAAGTTVLGVIPLFPDPFWNAMAASIMGGLSVGAALTIVLFPVFYATLHGIQPPEASAAPESTGSSA
ncbi:MAG: efflux RND transporter permease subunit [Myxococcota bacterium]|nr:efflux RND transporter permease subunit [Myxococcota bacterium]